MTAFKLQFIIAGILSLVVGLFLFFWKSIDSAYANKERSEKSVKRTRILYAVLFVFGGIVAILTAIFDWKIGGSIIPKGY